MDLNHRQKDFQSSTLPLSYLGKKKLLAFITLSTPVGLIDIYDYTKIKKELFVSNNDTGARGALFK